MLIGIFAWGLFGTAETKIGIMGACVKGEVICFLPDEKASSIHAGDAANVSGEQMQVASISAVPVSYAEARQIVGSDYLANTIVGDDWTYVVRFGGNDGSNLMEDIPLGINITTERIAPINLVFGNAVR